MKSKAPFLLSVSLIGLFGCTPSDLENVSGGNSSGPGKKQVATTTSKQDKTKDKSDSDSEDGVIIEDGIMVVDPYLEPSETKTKAALAGPQGGSVGGAIIASSGYGDDGNGTVTVTIDNVAYSAPSYNARYDRELLPEGPDSIDYQNSTVSEEIIDGVNYRHEEYPIKGSEDVLIQTFVNKGDRWENVSEKIQDPEGNILYEYDSSYPVLRDDEDREVSILGGVETNAYNMFVAELRLSNREEGIKKVGFLLDPGGEAVTLSFDLPQSADYTGKAGIISVATIDQGVRMLDMSASAIFGSTNTLNISIGDSHQYNGSITGSHFNVTGTDNTGNIEGSFFGLGADAIAGVGYDDFVADGDSEATAHALGIVGIADIGSRDFGNTYGQTNLGLEPSELPSKASVVGSQDASISDALLTSSGYGDDGTETITGTFGGVVYSKENYNVGYDKNLLPGGVNSIDFQSSTVSEETIAGVNYINEKSSIIGTENVFIETYKVNADDSLHFIKEAIQDTQGNVLYEDDGCNKSVSLLDNDSNRANILDKIDISSLGGGTDTVVNLHLKSNIHSLGLFDSQDELKNVGFFISPFKTSIENTPLSSLPQSADYIGKAGITSVGTFEQGVRELDMTASAVFGETNTLSISIDGGHDYSGDIIGSNFSVMGTDDTGSIEGNFWGIGANEIAGVGYDDFIADGDSEATVHALGIHGVRDDLLSK